MASPRTQTANAIAAIHRKDAHQLEIPEIDFTQHQLENGEVVSTTERVVKDVSGVGAGARQCASADRVLGRVAGCGRSAADGLMATTPSMCPERVRAPGSSNRGEKERLSVSRAQWR
jgi:hypothetical protein